MSCSLLSSTRFGKLGIAEIRTDSIISELPWGQQLIWLWNLCLWLAIPLLKIILPSSIEEFSILELFAVNGHLDKSPTIKQVDWLPPHCGWFKCNMTKGSPGHAGGGGIFRDKSVVVLGCFATYYGITHSIHAELHAIELAHQKGWHPLWLEWLYFGSLGFFRYWYCVLVTPRTRWKNCLMAMEIWCTEY